MMRFALFASGNSNWERWVSNPLNPTCNRQDISHVNQRRQTPSVAAVFPVTEPAIESSQQLVNSMAVADGASAPVKVDLRTELGSTQTMKAEVFVQL